MQFTETRKLWFVPGEDGTAHSIHATETWQNMETAGWCLLREHSVTIDVDVESDAAVQKIINGLEEAKSTIRAQAGSACTSIDQSIAGLLQLSFTPAADADAPALKDVGDLHDEL